MTALADDIDAVHERIRCYIEDAYPGFHVTQIRNRSETHYHLVDPYTFPSEYALMHVDPLFTVWAEKGVATMACSVMTLSDGSLLVDIQEKGARR